MEGVLSIQKRTAGVFVTGWGWGLRGEERTVRNHYRSKECLLSKRGEGKRDMVWYWLGKSNRPILVDWECRPKGVTVLIEERKGGRVVLRWPECYTANNELDLEKKFKGMVGPAVGLPVAAEKEGAHVQDRSEGRSERGGGKKEKKEEVGTSPAQNKNEQQGCRTARQKN